MILKLINLFSSGSGFLKTLSFSVIFTLILALSIISYLYKNTLEKLNFCEIKTQIAQENTRLLNEALTKQNKALKELEIKEYKPLEVETIKEIKIKDSTCEAELKGYKQLFKELAR
ncbi:MAG: hypothetical protein PUB96_08625 [Helicobacteraceae bacterium]|nr:hypothetical protein [Helicobacteraceae bacterium]